MSGGEGGSWCGQDMRLGMDLNELVSYRPLVAFKILALHKIVELGGSPIVKITLTNEISVEGYFDSMSLERGSFNLNIQTSNNETITVEPLSIYEIFVIDQDSDHITEESILKMNRFNAEIEEYFKTKRTRCEGGNN
jgi:hypothetical protein